MFDFLCHCRVSTYVHRGAGCLTPHLPLNLVIGLGSFKQRLCKSDPNPNPNLVIGLGSCKQRLCKSEKRERRATALAFHEVEREEGEASLVALWWLGWGWQYHIACTYSAVGQRRARTNSVMCVRGSDAWVCHTCLCHRRFTAKCLL